MIKNFINLIKSRVRNEKGQGMVEYALIIGLIAVVVVAVLALMGNQIVAKFNAIVEALK